MTRYTPSGRTPPMNAKGIPWASQQSDEEIAASRARGFWVTWPELGGWLEPTGPIGQPSETAREPFFTRTANPSIVVRETVRGNEDRVELVPKFDAGFDYGFTPKEIDHITEECKCICEMKDALLAFLKSNLTQRIAKAASVTNDLSNTVANSIGERFEQIGDTVNDLQDTLANDIGSRLGPIAEVISSLGGPTGEVPFSSQSNDALIGYVTSTLQNASRATIAATPQGKAAAIQAIETVKPAIAEITQRTGGHIPQPIQELIDRTQAAIGGQGGQVPNLPGVVGPIPMPVLPGLGFRPPQWPVGVGGRGQPDAPTPGDPNDWRYLTSLAQCINGVGQLIPFDDPRCIAARGVQPPVGGPGQAPFIPPVIPGQPAQLPGMAPGQPPAAPSQPPSQPPSRTRSNCNYDYRNPCRPRGTGVGHGSSDVDTSSEGPAFANSARRVGDFGNYRPLAGGNGYTVGPGQGPHDTNDILLFADEDENCVREASNALLCPPTNGQAGSKEGGSWQGNREAGGLDFSSSAICEGLRLLNGTSNQGNNWPLSTFLGNRSATGNEIAYSSTNMYKQLEKDSPFPSISNAIGSILFSLGQGISGFADKTAATMLAGNECDVGSAMPGWVSRIVIGLLEKWISGDIGELSKPLDYTTAFYCPMELPGATDAIGAYLTNSINKETLDCYLRLNNQKPGPYTWVVDSRRTRHTPYEYAALWRHRMIDENDFKQRIRELGYLGENDQFWFDVLTRWIPPATDLIRFMVRDTADENIVTQFGLDSEFTDKWTGQLKEWGHYQGVSDDVARHYWRSHWVIPSPQQLLDFYHRFRWKPANDPAHTNIQTVETALRQQDIPQFWIDRFVAASFHPLTRIDLQRAYEVGAIDLGQLIDGYKALGYSDEDAATLAIYADRRLAVRWSKDPIVKAFVAGELNQSEIDNYLTAQGLPNGPKQIALSIAQTTAIRRRKKACIKGLKRNFTLGGIQPAAAQASLQQIGLDANQALDLVAEWQCEASVKTRLPSVSVLCGWFDRGAIGPAQFIQRLTTMGYQAFEAQQIVTDCQVALNKRQRREAEIATRKAAALEEKQARQTEAQIKAAQKQQEKMAKLANARIAAEEKRSATILQCAEALAELEGSSVSAAGIVIRAAMERIRQTHGVSRELALKCICRAIDGYQPENGIAFESVVADHCNVLSGARNGVSS